MGADARLFFVAEGGDGPFQGVSTYFRGIGAYCQLGRGHGRSGTILATCSHPTTADNTGARESGAARGRRPRQQPPRGRTDAAVAGRLLPAVPASPNGSWPVANGCCDPVVAAEFQRSSRGRSCPPEAGAGQELPSRGRSRAAAAAATPGRATGDFDGKKRVLTGVNASTKRRSFDGQHALTKLIDVSLGRTRRDFGTFGPSERLCMFFGCR